MSSLKGVVGARKIKWKKAPVGASGEGEVEVDGKNYTIAWRRDSEGVYVEFPHGCFGYDFSGEVDEVSGSLLYRVSQRGSDQVSYGLRFRGDGESAVDTASTGKKRSIRVRAQMPGKIVRVLVATGEKVTKEQPMLVMEAMKMENEIRASSAGTVSSLKVSEGQAVESGADLILID